MAISEEERRKRYFESKRKNAISLRDRQIQKAKIGKGYKPKIKEKNIETISLDEQTYEIVWNNFPTNPHRCEECGKFLGFHFRDEFGKVIDRFRYSHILAKGSHPKLRFLPLNFRLYCKVCHNKWEFGTDEERKKMKTYDISLINKLYSIESYMYENNIDPRKPPRDA